MRVVTDFYRLLPPCARLAALGAVAGEHVALGPHELRDFRLVHGGELIPTHLRRIHHYPS
eukprot:863435-Pyramimonas_sp.AAC.2